MRSPNFELPPHVSENPAFLSSDPESSHMRLISSAEVYLEFFRGLPIQLRVCNDHGEYTCMLPYRFRRAYAFVLNKLGPKVSRDTEWSFYGRRHGNLEEVADLVLSELDAAIDTHSLEEWKVQALRDREMALSHIIFSLALLRASTQQVFLA
ncbi:MAG: hypothetical protein EP343_13410 [Deltaproteobacteria bacterium]|nr:MAG: hypothetical protein EP343_13410 [Deltaproteobacteria bacterium]